MASLKSELRMHWATGGMVVRLIMVNILVFLVLTTLFLLKNNGVPIPVQENDAFWLSTTSDLPVLVRR